MKVRVACYMTLSSSMRIKKSMETRSSPWREVNQKGSTRITKGNKCQCRNSVCKFREDGTWLERKHLQGEWKGI